MSGSKDEPADRLVSHGHGYDTPSRKHAPRGRIKAHLMDAPRLMDASHGKDYEPCVGTSKQSGKRCLRRPIPGGTVCIIHGGGAPQVQAKAEERLRALVDPAISRLAELIEQKEFPSVAIAAVKDALDRNLGKAHESLAVSHSGKVDIVSLLRQRHAKHKQSTAE